MTTKNLDKIFKPKSIAVIGASNREGAVGYIVLKNLIDSKYEGKVYPINQRNPTIQNVKAYPTVGMFETVDLALYVPNSAVPDC